MKRIYKRRFWNAKTKEFKVIKIVNEKNFEEDNMEDIKVEKIEDSDSTTTESNADSSVNKEEKNKVFKEDNNEKARKHFSPKKKSGSKIWVIGFFVILALLVMQIVFSPITVENGKFVVGFFGKDVNNDNPNGNVDVKKANAIDFELFVMSQCPYGVVFEDELVKVMDKIGDYINLDIEFIGEIEGEVLSSMHGQNEVDGNIIQICAKKYYPNNYLNFIACMNKDYSKIPGNWEACANELKYDVDKLNKCYTGEEGKSLLKKSFELAISKGASGSPTYFINGVQGVGRKYEDEIMRLVCNAIKGDKPKECGEIPECSKDADCTAEPTKDGICQNPGNIDAKCVYNEPIEVDMYFVKTSDCTSCEQIPDLVASLKQLFKGLKITQIDATDDLGEEIVQATGIKKVPAYVFGSSIAETQSFKTNPNLQAAFENKGDYYLLSDSIVGATWFICQEERQEFLDTLGITGDKPVVDLFVMSFCPYGNIAEELFEPVYKNLGDSFVLRPRYIVYSNYGGGGPSYCIDEDSKYCSMHGIGERKQDIREQCVLYNVGVDKWFEFIMEINAECNARNVEDCWEDIAESIDLDPKDIKECYEENKVAYSEEDLKMMKLLGASGSPAIYINGETYSGARTSQAYQDAICALMKEKAEGCSKTIASSGEPASVGSC